MLTVSLGFNNMSVCMCNESSFIFLNSFCLDVDLDACYMYTYIHNIDILLAQQFLHSYSFTFISPRPFPRPPLPLPTYTRVHCNGPHIFVVHYYYDVLAVLDILVIFRGCSVGGLARYLMYSPLNKVMLLGD